MFSIAQLNPPQKVTKPAGARPISQLRSVLQQSGLASEETEEMKKLSDELDKLKRGFIRS